MIHTFAIPDKNLNTDIFFKDTGWDLYILEGQLCISGDCTKKQAQDALDAHNPPAIKEPTVEEKLASVGLSIDDLKAALGL
jgi:hypothetical protein